MSHYFFRGETYCLLTPFITAPHNSLLTTNNLYNLITSKPQNLKTSQPHNLKTLINHKELGDHSALAILVGAIY